MGSVQSVAEAVAGRQRFWCTGGSAHEGALAICLTSGRRLQGAPLTWSGTAYEPKVAWTGTLFGVLYLHAQSWSQFPQLHMKTVSPSGCVWKEATELGSVEHCHTPFIVSDLIWNQKESQFAFAYSKKGLYEIEFKLLDAGLNSVGRSFAFALPSTGGYRSQLTYLSCTYNSVREEYGLVFVEEQHPYVRGVQHPIWFIGFDPEGGITSPPRRLVSSNGTDHIRPSLSSDPCTGLYALAYHERKYPYNRLKFLLFSPGVWESSRQIMAGWRTAHVGEDLRLVHDPVSGDYAVAATKFPGELCWQMVKSSGASSSDHAVKMSTVAIDRIFSLDGFGHSAHSNLVCASASGLIRMWQATDAGHGSSDIITSDPAHTCGSPCMKVLNDTDVFVSWVQDGVLMFGRPEG